VHFAPKVLLNVVVICTILAQRHIVPCSVVDSALVVGVGDSVNVIAALLVGASSIVAERRRRFLKGSTGGCDVAMICDEERETGSGIGDGERTNVSIWCGVIGRTLPAIVVTCTDRVVCSSYLAV
jgi:hypothetical protein